MRRLDLGGVGLLEAPVALLENDHVAEPARPGGEVESDLLCIDLDRLAPTSGITAEDPRARYLPVVGEVLELKNCVELEAGGCDG